MLSTSRIAELAGLEGFADIANELAALALPGFRIQCVDGQPARGASKLGGLPEFRPERFLDEDAGREGWIPFGGGKRHCVGSHLALLELKVITREVLRRLELEPLDPTPERPRVHHVTLVPSKLTRVRARRRKPAVTA